MTGNTWIVQVEVQHATGRPPTRGSDGFNHGHGLVGCRHDDLAGLLLLRSLAAWEQGSRSCATSAPGCQAQVSIRDHQPSSVPARALQASPGVGRAWRRHNGQGSQINPSLAKPELHLSGRLLWMTRVESTIDSVKNEQSLSGSIIFAWRDLRYPKPSNIRPKGGRTSFCPSTCLKSKGWRITDSNYY